MEKSKENGKALCNSKQMKLSGMLKLRARTEPYCFDALINLAFDFHVCTSKYTKPLFQVSVGYRLVVLLLL